MHVDFADWYRPCTTGTEKNLTEELLTARWKGIDKLTNGPKVLELVRTILQRPSTDAAYLARFKMAFKEGDATFQMSGNHLELSVLAGSLLSEILAKETECADQAALGLVCMVGIAASKPDWIGPFIRNAQIYLDLRLRNLRKPSVVAIPEFEVAPLKSQIDTFVSKLAENQPAQCSEAAKSLLDLLIMNLSTATVAAAGAFTELQRQSILRKEETDVLSWLTSAVSRDVRMTFVDLKPPAASLIAGKELADLVGTPGILPARSILQGIIPPIKSKAAEKMVTILASVNATDRAWRQEVVQKPGLNAVADLCPVLGALQASLTTDETDGWVGGYRKSYGIDPNAALDPTDLSFQMHRECLLVKA
ncbi:MAG: hypothetical protein JWM11_1216 [Planctomycetaceae bacterium]|nr:hypothetical protein [Planctomycetaceae bacterium]